jgi:hypothetical protein
LISRKFGDSFVVAGCLYDQPATSSVERYDPATDTWAYVADMLDNRYALCAITICTARPAEEQDLFDSLIAKASNN